MQLNFVGIVVIVAQKVCVILIFTKTPDHTSRIGTTGPDPPRFLKDIMTQRRLVSADCTLIFADRRIRFIIVVGWADGERNYCNVCFFDFHLLLAWILLVTLPSRCRFITYYRIIAMRWQMHEKHQKFCKLNATRFSWVFFAHFCGGISFWLVYGSTNGR